MHEAGGGLRVFHVVESLDRGAVENWLVNVFLESRKIKPDWQWTFYCMLDKPGRLDDMVLENGGCIIRSPVSVSHKTAFLRNLRKALRRGRYDVLHVHHDFLSGFYLLATVGMPFRRRILHIHNNDRILPVASRRLEKILLPIFRWLSLKMVDKVLAISEFTRDDYRRGYAGASPTFEVLYYGIRMDKFEEPVDAGSVRSRLGIPKGAGLLLFVGRLNRDKNPMFALEVLASLLRRGGDFHLVILGKGEMEAELRARVVGLRLAERVRILGWSDAVHELMMSADAFLFPRLEHPREGLGLVVVEAQCTGLPMFITPGIVGDAVEVQELAHWNSPEDPDHWAEAIENALASGTAVSRSEALGRMKSSRFGISTATRNLLAHYA